MAANLAPPQRGPQAPPAGGLAGGQPGSEAGPPVNAQALAGGFGALFAFYLQLEQNQKQKADTEAKFNIMVDRINAGQLQAATLHKLQGVLGLVEQSNHQGAQAAFRELTQKCWGDVKDFSNALKVLSSFKQKYQQ